MPSFKAVHWNLFSSVHCHLNLTELQNLTLLSYDFPLRFLKGVSVNVPSQWLLWVNKAWTWEVRGECLFPKEFLRSLNMLRFMAYFLCHSKQYDLVGRCWAIKLPYSLIAKVEVTEANYHATTMPLLHGNSGGNLWHL